MTYQFFNDISDEIAFYVMKLNGHPRMEKLNITSFCYHSDEYAKKWRDETAAKLDKSKPYYDEVVAAIDDIYLRMID